MSTDRSGLSEDVVAVGALVAVAAWIRWPYLSQGLWWDEYDVVYFGSMSVGLLLETFAAIESHPPLYALVGKALLGVLGDSAVALRVASFSAALATVVAVYALGRAVLCRRAGLLAAALLAVTPLHVDFSSNARSLYPLFTLLATVASLAFWGMLERPERRTRWAVAYGLVVGLALNTHYYAVVLVAAHLVWYGATRGWQRLSPGVLAASLGGAAALFYPWFWRSNVLPTAGTFDAALTPWVPKLGLETLARLVGEIVRHPTSVGVALVLLVGLAVLVRRGARDLPRAGVGYVVALVVLPTAFLLALSAILERTHGSAVLQPRHVVFLTPVLVLVLAVVFSGFEVRFAGGAFVLALVAGSLGSMPARIVSQERIAQDLAAELRPGDVVMVFPMLSFQVFAHQARDVLPAHAQVVPLVEFGDSPERVRNRLDGVLARTDRVWLVDRYHRDLATDPALATASRAAIEMLESARARTAVTIYDGGIPWQVLGYDIDRDAGTATRTIVHPPEARFPAWASDALIKLAALAFIVALVVEVREAIRRRVTGP